MKQDGFTTSNDLYIPVSRNAFKEVKKKYIDYSFQTEG